MKFIHEPIRKHTPFRYTIGLKIPNDDETYRVVIDRECEDPFKNELIAKAVDLVVESVPSLDSLCVTECKLLYFNCKELTYELLLETQAEA